MQTLNQFTEKIDELLATAKATMRLEAERLYRSGAVDPASYDDNFVLPKIILQAVLLNEAYRWELPDKRHQREVRNLQKF